MSDEAVRKRRINEEIAMLKNLIAIDKTNSAKDRMTPSQKAQHELRFRVKPGLNKASLEYLKGIETRVLDLFESWFENNKFTVCPITNWLWLLKEMRVNLGEGRSAMFFNLIARNDGAIYRWRNRTDEWYMFSRESAEKRLLSLKKQLVERKEDKLDAASIFDGKI